MQEKLGLNTINIAHKALEPQMNIIFLIMNLSWRIVSDENINGRKLREKRVNLTLIEQEVSYGLIPPGSGKATKLNISYFDIVEMHIRYLF